MKNIIQYISVFLLLIIAGTSCEDNANWRIVTDVQPGVYIAGEATVFSAVAPAAAFKAAPVDGDATQYPGMLSKFTWLKAGSEFTIVKSDNEGNTVNYGKGSVVSGETLALQADGPAFTVSEDGLYFLVYNSGQTQLTILPAKFGVIGSATPGAWDKETLLPNVVFDESSMKVIFTGDIVMSKAEMKFRFNNTWGASIPFDASTNVTIHTNQGATAPGVNLNNTAAELKDGGDNLNVPDAASYAVTLTFDLKQSKFSTSAIQGEIIPPSYPATMYMIGDQFGSWDWNSPDVVTLNPVNGKEGEFWCIRYIEANRGFKWCPNKAWSGDFAQLDEAIGYTVKDGNAVVAESGMYMVYINMPTGQISIESPKVYGIGDCFGGWDTGKYPFAVSGQTMVNATTGSGELRMYANSDISTAGGDWWRMEFIILNGSIVYRGNGGDQERVNVDAGKTITLDFNSESGTIQ